MSFSSIEQSQFLAQLVEHYHFSLPGGVEYRYTNAPTEQTLTTGDGTQNGTYTPESISTSEPEHSREYRGGNLQVNMPRTNAVALAFRQYPPEAEIRVRVYRKHVSDNEVTTWWRGSIRAVTFRETGAQLECNPTLGKNEGLGLWVKFQLYCNLEPYSARCGVDRNDFKDTLTVTAIDGNQITVSAHGHADEWYAQGYVETADGSRRHIRAHVGNDLTLILNFDTLDIGDTVNVFAGDDLTHTTCRTKFFASGDSSNPNGNIANFFGFFTMPNLNPFRQNVLPKAANPSLVDGGLS